MSVGTMLEGMYTAQRSFPIWFAQMKRLMRPCNLDRMVEVKLEGGSEYIRYPMYCCRGPQSRTDPGGQILEK